LGFWFFAAQAFAVSAWIAFRKGAPSISAKQNEERFPFALLALLCAAVILVAAGGVKVGVFSTTGIVAACMLCLVGFLWRDGRAVQGRLLPKRPFNLRTPTGAALLMILSLSVATVVLGAYPLQRLTHAVSQNQA